MIYQIRLRGMAVVETVVEVEAESTLLAQIAAMAKTKDVSNSDFSINIIPPQNLEIVEMQKRIP